MARTAAKDLSTYTHTGNLTWQEAKIGAEKHIDMLEASPESQVNFGSDEQEEFVFNQPEAWGSSTIDY